MHNENLPDSLDGIAVVGMAGRFPKAQNLEQFWQNLRDGVEAATQFSDEELLEAGVDPKLLKNPNYVKSGAILDDFDQFDAHFFDYMPREAEVMDPQHRIFLECAWHALENAGYDPEKYRGAIAMFAGSAMNSYLSHHILTNPQVLETVGGLQLMIGNDKDFTGMNASYKFNLRGPSLNIQTACSTSLVAISQACQSLQNYQCDMAMAGGVSVRMLQKSGYLYQPGGIGSPDGHCRTFDAKAQGTFAGDGVGVVLLKRLEDAVTDGDNILAVVKGWAINNDGSMKVGYTAPSVEGQAEAISLAQALAGFDADTISYIEAHGTATELGDPIEITALTRAFRASTDKTGFCAIGAVKSNIGHLDAAAGVAGFIKTVLAMQHKALPPSLHFEKPNPKIDFANSPFFVNHKLTPWQPANAPRRAGVSSFGVGGTNAHVVLEEAPVSEQAELSKPWQLLQISAKTASALDTATDNLAHFLKNHPNTDLGDAAYTLQIGRKDFRHRRIAVCRDVADAAAVLDAKNPNRVFSDDHEPGSKALAFMFPGQGAQYVDMGKELYQTEPLFRETVDQCCELIAPELGFDLREALFPRDTEQEAAAEKLKQTAVTQPALFVVEYALAKLWMSWGIAPQAMIGHSIGEYVAACLAGVFSLADALELVVVRGRLMQQQPAGDMLAVSLPVDELKPLLPAAIDLAAVNAPGMCVVSGPHAGIEQFAAVLDGKKVISRKLHTSHAFHSSMMDSMLEVFTEAVRKIELSAPAIPFISNVTGNWISAAEATDPGYWARHLRHAVLFADGVKTLLAEPSRVLLEVGPGRTLASLSGMVQMAEQGQQNGRAKQTILTSMRHPDEKTSDRQFLLQAVGKLWLGGISVDWQAFHQNEKRRRVPLPLYPFERQRYWIEPGQIAPTAASPSNAIAKKQDIADWFYAPSWTRSAPLRPVARQASGEKIGHVLVFAAESDTRKVLLEKLRQQADSITVVRCGDGFSRTGDDSFALDPANGDDYRALMTELQSHNKTPEKIVHLWSLDSEAKINLTLGFDSLLLLAQALAARNVTSKISLLVGSYGLHEVTGGETLLPQNAMLLAACTVIAQEYTNIVCRSIDFAEMEQSAVADRIHAEVMADASELTVAWRGKHRWVQTFSPSRFEQAGGKPDLLRENGVYLITGGLGRIGLVLAKYLAGQVKAKLVLTARTPLPERAIWQTWLDQHDENDPSSTKIRAIQSLENNGAEVLPIAADAADAEQMQAVFAQAEQQFGNISGVIHAAGILDGDAFQSIQDLSPGDCERHFKPKIDGVQALEAAIGARQLDFCMLVSSISSVLGGLGFAGYAAANVYLDAFAAQKNTAGGFPWLSVNWDAWHFGGGSEAPELALTAEEGAEAVHRIFASGVREQIIVSTGDLQARIDQWVKLEALHKADKPQQAQPAARHARPQLQTEYTAPRNDVEQSLTNLWQELFGIEQIGIHDNFFDLGGHSLLATALIGRVRDEFQIMLTLQSFFDNATIAELAEQIFARLVEQEDDDLLSEMLAELEQESGEGIE